MLVLIVLIVDLDIISSNVAISFIVLAIHPRFIIYPRKRYQRELQFKFTNPTILITSLERFPDLDRLPPHLPRLVPLSKVPIDD